MSQPPRRAWHIPAPAPSASASGSSGIPRPASSALPRPSSVLGSSSSRIPSFGGPATSAEDAYRKGIRSAMPERRTFHAGQLPPSGGPRSLANTNTDTLPKVGQKRRASQTYVLEPSSDADGREEEIDSVFDQPLSNGRGEEAPPPSKRPFGHSSRLSNTSLASEAHASASKPPRARESLTSVADLSAVRHDYQIRLVQSDSRAAELERELIDKTRQLERFQKERLDMLSEWETLQVQKAEREKAHTAEMEGLRVELKECREFLGVSENDLDAKTRELDTLRQSAKQQSTKLEMEVIEARQMKETAEAERQRLEKQNGDIRRELEEMRRVSSARDPTMTIGRRAEDDGSNEKLREELKRQVTSMKALQASAASLRAENERFKAQLSSIELLREEKMGLEAKVRGLEMRNMELIGLEEEVKKVKEDMTRWEDSIRIMNAAAATSSGSSSSENDLRNAMRIAESGSDDLEALSMPPRPTPLTRNTLPTYLSTLESSLSVSLSKIRGLLEVQKGFGDQKRRLEEEIEAGEQRIMENERMLSERRIVVERAELAEKRAKEERDRYKSLLDSFQVEQKIKKTSFDEANLQRIDVAEQQVRRAEEENEELESKLRSAQKQAEEYEVQAKEALSQLEKAKQQQQQRSSAPPSSDATAQLAMLEKELQKIGEENEKLWSRVGRGEFDQERYQVLTLGGGPLQKERDLRTKRLDALKEENEALLRRVDELSAAVTSAGGGGSLGQGGSGGAEWVPRASVETLQQELDALRTEIKMKDKAMLRLREVFQRKADEFNEAVRCLFGWKLKFLGSGKVKIVSDFSKGSNKTTLVFRPSDQGDTGDMRLTGEALKEGMADVQGLGEKWLRQDALYSIPCFLSEINQQLFESCTRARVMFGIPPPDEEDDA